MRHDSLEMTMMLGKFIDANKEKRRPNMRLTGKAEL